MTKKIGFLMVAFIISFSNAHAHNWDELIKIAASDRAVDDVFGMSVAISGNYAIVGAYMEDEDALGENSLSSAGSAYILFNDNGIWQEMQKITASDRAADDQFGWSVAISGDYAIVGASMEDEDALGENSLGAAGSAYIFYNNNGIWQQVQKLTASDRALYDCFGWSVSISDDYAIVGSVYNDTDASGENYRSNAGSAYIFYNNNGIWQQIQKVTASDRALDDHFGFSVAISGDYAIVGARYEDHDASGEIYRSAAGSAYVYYNNNGIWQQAQKITASDRSMEDHFGFSVAISGNYVIVGARYEDHDASGENYRYLAGSAYIFYNNNGTWQQVQKIVASDRTFEDLFGTSVSISGNYIIVGANGQDMDVSGENYLSVAGSAYIFYNNNGIWQQVQKITAFNRAAGDQFGYSVAISGDHSIVGAYGDDEDASDENTLSQAGSAYIFKAAIPNITDQPINQSDVCPNSTVQLSLAGDNIEMYQWQESLDSGNSFMDITNGSVYSGSQTNTLNVLVSTGMNNYHYRCLVSNSYYPDPLPDYLDRFYSDTVMLTIDNIDPGLLVQNIMVQLNENGNTTIEAKDVVISTTDNCTIADTTLSQSVFDCDDIGNISIDVTVSDIAGNTITETSVITIEDNISPVIECPGDQVVDADNVANSYTLTTTAFDPVSANDNCSFSILNDYNSSSSLNGAIFPLGTTIVTWTVTDEAGNFSNCLFTVLVNTFVGINELNNSGIFIYPNPAESKIFIESAKTIKSVIIKDIIGRTVYTNREFINKKAIDLSEIKKGIYFISIQTNEVTYTTKFVKE